MLVSVSLSTFPYNNIVFTLLVDSAQNAFDESEDLAMSNPILKSVKTPKTPVGVDGTEEPRS